MKRLNMITQKCIVQYIWICLSLDIKTSNTCSMQALRNVLGERGGGKESVTVTLQNNTISHDFVY